MKIVNVMLSRGLGGIEQAVVDYSEALVLAGYKAHAIVHPQADIIPALEKNNIPYSTLTNLGAWDIVAILKLRGMLDVLAPDVCIAHGNRAISLLTYAAGKRKLVTVTHNYKTKYGNIKTVFCPTKDLIRFTRNHARGQRDIHHIPNMVRTRPQMPQRTPHQPPVIGTMGRFVAKKGFNLFIEGIDLLKSRGLKFRAIIAGSGEEGQKLKSLVEERQLTDIISFPGWVTDKQAFYDSIDIFCLPSLHEPFGIVLLEAMAQGLPVVSTASEGPSEIIDNSINGLLVEKGSAERLADGLQKMLSEPLKAKDMGENAFDTVYNNYDVSVISVKLDHALKAIV